MNRIQNIAAWILPLTLAYIFLQSGWAKIDWAQSVMENFEHWGYPYWFVQVIGIGEILGAILLLLPRMSVVGVGILSAIMTGAVCTHLRWHEYQQALVPLTLIGVFAYLIVLRYKLTFTKPQAMIQRSSGCPG